MAVCLVLADSARRKFHQPDNITDQFNNRVIEGDPARNIAWLFGKRRADIAANLIIGTKDAESLEDPTLMAGSGIPDGATKLQEGWP